MRSQTETKLRSKKILLIDDDREFSNDLAFLLDGAYQIVTVSESKESIELLEKQEFDLVILDLKMPCFLAEEDEMEGIELLRMIRQKWGAQIPVIILSKMDTQQNRRKCEDLKADEFLAKPPEIDILKKKIDELLT